MKKILLAALISAAHLPAFAAGASTGTVSYLFVHQPNILMFAAGTPTGAPGCSNLGQWAIEIDSSFGKSVYALLLSAQSQGQTVTVSGTGVCSAWSDRESPRYVYVTP